MQSNCTLLSSRARETLTSRSSISPNKYAVELHLALVSCTRDAHFSLKYQFLQCFWSCLLLGRWAGPVCAGDPAGPTPLRSCCKYAVKLHLALVSCTRDAHFSLKYQFLLQCFWSCLLPGRWAGPGCAAAGPNPTPVISCCKYAGKMRLALVWCTRDDHFSLKYQFS